MYNLLKAKEEIDTVAKHTTDLAAHVLAITGGIDRKLESFKKEILDAIDVRFNELERAIVGGEHRDVESSAISDLGAKVSQLLHSTSLSPDQQSDRDGHSDDQTHGNDFGHSNDGHSGDHDQHGYHHG